MPFNIGPMELAIVLVIALIVLGPKRLPEVGRSLGRGMREFKDSIAGHSRDDDEDGEELPAITSRESHPATATRPAAEARPPAETRPTPE